MAGKTPDEDDPALRARLDRLSDTLDRRRAEEAADEAKRDGGRATSSAMNVGLRAMSEFVAAVMVGGFIGWRLDIWFATTPFLLIFFLMIGAAAGFWGIYRIAAQKTR